MKCATTNPRGNGGNAGIEIKEKKIEQGEREGVTR